MDINHPRLQLGLSYSSVNRFIRFAVVSSSGVVVDLQPEKPSSVPPFAIV